MSTTTVAPRVEVVWTPEFTIHGQEHREIWLRCLSAEVMTLAGTLRLLPTTDRDRITQLTFTAHRDGDVIVPRPCSWTPALPEPQDRELGYRHDEWWTLSVNPLAEENAWP